MDQEVLLRLLCCQQWLNMYCMYVHTCVGMYVCVCTYICTVLVSVILMWLLKWNVMMAFNLPFFLLSPLHLPSIPPFLPSLTLLTPSLSFFPSCFIPSLPLHTPLSPVPFIPPPFLPSLHPFFQQELVWHDPLHVRSVSPLLPDGHRTVPACHVTHRPAVCVDVCRLPSRQPPRRLPALHTVSQ